MLFEVYTNFVLCIKSSKLYSCLCTMKICVCIIMSMLLLPCYFTVIGTPTGVTASRIGYNSVNISWMAPLKGPAVASYEVFYQLTGGGSIVSGGNTSNTELTLTGLTLGNYSFFVVGFGAKLEPVLPSDPSNITITTIIGEI